MCVCVCVCVCLCVCVSMCEWEGPITRSFYTISSKISSFNRNKDEACKETWFSSVTQPCPTLCDTMDSNRTGFPVHHQKRGDITNYQKKILGNRSCLVSVARFCVLKTKTLLKNLKTELPYNPAIPHLGIYPEKNSNLRRYIHIPQCSLQQYLQNQGVETI